MVGVFVIVTTILALVEGFQDTGRQGYAFLGIACCCFTITTFYLQFKITTGDLSDAARIPVYGQLAVCVFLGISILITIYSDWHPPELDWYLLYIYTLSMRFCEYIYHLNIHIIIYSYYNDSKTFVRQTSPNCWTPPSCFHSSSQCLLYISAGGLGDVCGTVKSVTNNTGHYTNYTCNHIVNLPTPKPTPPPVQPSSPPPSSLAVDPPKSANKYEYNALGDTAEEQEDLLGYLNSYYSQYVNDDKHKKTKKMETKGY